MEARMFGRKVYQSLTKHFPKSSHALLPVPRPLFRGVPQEFRTPLCFLNKMANKKKKTTIRKSRHFLTKECLPLPKQNWKKDKSKCFMDYRANRSLYISVIIWKESICLKVLNCVWMWSKKFSEESFVWQSIIFIHKNISTSVIAINFYINPSITYCISSPIIEEYFPNSMIFEVTQKQRGDKWLANFKGTNCQNLLEISGF